MIVVWSAEAQQDRAAIWDYIAADNSVAAVEMDSLFSNAAARLEAHPKIGRRDMQSFFVPDGPFGRTAHQVKNREVSPQVAAVPRPDIRGDLISGPCGDIRLKCWQWRRRLPEETPMSCRCNADTFKGLNFL